MTTDSALRPSATRIARSTAMVIGLFAIAKAFSLVSNWVALQRFGVGAAWGTFNAANQLPEQLFNLLAGGALAYAFIPVFGGFLTHDDRSGAYKLASNVLNTVFLAVALFSILVFLFAPWIVAHLVAPGFASPFVDMSDPLNALHTFYHPDLVMQTAALMRILLLSLLIFSISGLVGGILHTNQHFLSPTLAPIMYDVGNVFGILVLARFFGIYGAAMGAVIGAGLHLLIQVPGLIKVKAHWYPILNWRDPALRQVIQLMIPRAIGLGLLNFNLLIAIRIASDYSAGSVAIFNRGWGLMQLPETIIGTAMGIVIFPTLATLSAAGDLRGKRAAMSGALRFILIAAIPAAVVMAVAGRQLVGILEGGAFDAEGVNNVFRVLQFFALGIVTHSAVEVVARSFYADKDTITPMFVAILTATVNLLLAFSLSRPNILGVPGLALANSLAVGVELSVLLLILRRRWQGIDEGILLATTLKALLAAAVMGIVMAVAASVLSHLGSGRIMSFFQAGVEVGIGGLVYLGVALVLRVDEVRQLPQLILRRQAISVPAAEVSGD